MLERLLKEPLETSDLLIELGVIGVNGGAPRLEIETLSFLLVRNGRPLIGSMRSLRLSAGAFQGTRPPLHSPRRT